MKRAVTIGLISILPASLLADTYIDPEQARLEIERAHFRVQAEMDSRLEAEDRNHEWADSIEMSITEPLLAINGFDSEDLSVVCKTTLCRVEINPFTEEQEAAYASEIWTVLASLPEIKPTISRTRLQVRYYLFLRAKNYQTAGSEVQLASQFYGRSSPIAAG